MSVRPAIFVYIDCIPPKRVWTGPRVYTLPADDTDTSGGDYLPLGLATLPTFDIMLGGDASEYSFLLRGDDEALIASVDEPANFSGATMYFGELRFDNRWQPLDEVDWFTTLEAETIGVNIGQSEGGNRTAVVEVVASTAQTDRRMADHIYWSSNEQAIISPTDKAFEYVNLLSAGTRRRSNG